MKSAKICLLLAPLMLLSGCMSYDTKLFSVKVKPDCGLEEGATFQNAPYYLSKDADSRSATSLSQIFQVDNKQIDHVKIKKTGSKLSAWFYDVNDQALANERAAAGLPYQPQGNKLIVADWSSCKPGEAGMGCMWSSRALFCTQDNDLAVKDSNGGAGLLVVVIPFVDTSSDLGLYKRLPDKK